MDHDRRTFLKTSSIVGMAAMTGASLATKAAAQGGATTAGAKTAEPAQLPKGMTFATLRRGDGFGLGLRTERWFSAMQRDLSEPIDAPAASEGVEVVAYTPDRAEDVREARNDAFRDHWGACHLRPSGGCSSSTDRSCGPTCRRSRSSTGASWRSASPR